MKATELTSCYKAPVLLFTYRKPQFLGEIFQAIKRYSPPRLYVASNRHACEEERSVVESIRRTIRDWQLPGEIVFLFQDKHLLINDAIHSGLDHVFNIEETAIVLEDDTVPAPPFFYFCNSMLERYGSTEDIGSIIGCNLGQDQTTEAFLSPLALFHWGWATWRSRWHQHRNTHVDWGNINDRLPSSSGLREHNPLLHFIGKLDRRTTWDLQWAIKQALQGQKTIIPGKNLITNKGFVYEGSYTNFHDSQFKNIPTSNEITITTPKNCEASASNYEKATTQLIIEILRNRNEEEIYFNDFP